MTDSQRVFCEQPHPGGDAEAEQWCRDYHRPKLPLMFQDLDVGEYEDDEEVNQP